ncbi:DUF2946 family protein [Methylotenera sp.]|uniref:DUF2946 family protein n=1 Tax=Methylotenera sp. TaxID=2051956 RepID=UPI002489C0F3|nr:DUF2946 family protein [Methylotenera sp.]MDI1300009.1 DUF2946 family protein [Methylotenera sp.]
MIRRSFLTFFFAVLLVFGQQQAMVHAYVHTADFQQQSSNQQSSTQKSSSEDKSTNHSEVCGKCLSLAGLSAAIGSQAHILNIASGQFELSTVLHQSVISTRFFSYHSRAPPILA